MLSNGEVAVVFTEMADIAEIRGGNAFKVRALRNAAETIEALPIDVCALAADPAELKAVQGIGASIAKKIEELAATGKLAEHEKLLEEFPPTLLEILKLEGVGPKKVGLFYSELGVKSVDDLETAARDERVRGLPRMSAKTELKLLKAIESHRARSGRFPLAVAEETAARIRSLLEAAGGVRRLETAGSLRRRRETVKDVDLLVACDDPEAVMDRFAGAGDVIGRGPTKCSIKLTNGMNVDLRVVPAESFGAALHYFTGSKSHNVAIRGLAVRQSLTINEYGVYETDSDGNTGKRLGGEDERDIFSAVGLGWVPPELRENRGEVDAAAAESLPRLVQLDDIRGDVHMHTTATDGSATIEEMALAATEQGYGYVAITDHSKALAMARGLDEARLREHAKAIRAVDDKLSGRIRVFSGIEVDIMKDGSLDLADDALVELDVVVASVHSHFHLSREEMTERLLRAIASGLVDIIGHPTGRLLSRRDPYPFDMEKILKSAREHGVAMELSAAPERLDLSDVHCRMARDCGVKIVINTDAHAPEHLSNMRYGVGNARRGWLEASHVLNTLASDEFLTALHDGHRS